MWGVQLFKRYANFCTEGEMMKMATKLIGAILLGMLLNACGGGSTTHEVVQDDTANNGSASTEIPECKADGTTVLVPTNGKCTYSDPHVNNGEKLTYSCDGSKVTNGFMTAKQITLNGVTFTCE